MIGGWSRLFFKRHNLGVSTIAAASLVATSVAFVNEARVVDKSALSGRATVGWVGGIRYSFDRYNMGPKFPKISVR